MTLTDRLLHKLYRDAQKFTDDNPITGERPDARDKRQERFVDKALQHIADAIWEQYSPKAKP